MSDSNITKLALANSIKKLMVTKSINKISVSDIVEYCGLTRQAFYYHFKDKYDLLNWIYYTETACFMSTYDTVDHWTDGLKELCYYMRQNNVFYINALNTTGQNSFQEQLYDYISVISMSVIENMTGTEFDCKKWEYVVDIFTTAFVGLIVHWANEGMKEDPTEYIASIRGIFDGSIYRVLEENARKTD